MQIKITVKKLWSLNLNIYKDITLENALNMYHEYIGFHKTTDNIKTFEKWLLTEI